MMQQFHKGKKERFFKLWNENLTPAVRDGDAVCKKLEFYVNIYFAVYPVKFARGQVGFENYCTVMHVKCHHIWLFLYSEVDIVMPLSFYLSVCTCVKLCIRDRD